MSKNTDFVNDGYFVARSLIHEERRQFLFDYVLATLGRMKMPKGDVQVPGTPSAYSDFTMETLLESLIPSLENLLELSLLPTYSYVRLYKKGDCLERHLDRAACEISASLCLGCVPSGPWPIWLEAQGTKMPISLHPGDALIYRGMLLPHWREMYQGEQMGQVFLHYVDRNGPYREWKFDKRPGLRTPAVSHPA